MDYSRIEDTREAPEYSENYCGNCEQYCHIDDQVSLLEIDRKYGMKQISVCAECEQNIIFLEWSNFEVKYEEHKGIVELLWTPEENYE